MQKLIWPITILSLLAALALNQLLIFHATEQFAAQHLLYLGKQRYAAGELRVAAAMIETSLAPPPRAPAQQLPGSGEAHYYLGRIAQQANRPNVALEQHRLALADFARPYLPLREIGYLLERKLQEEQQRNPGSARSREIEQELRAALTRSLAMNAANESTAPSGEYALVLADHYHRAALDTLSAAQAPETADKAGAAIQAADDLAAAWHYYLLADLLGVSGAERPLRTGIFLSNAGFYEIALCEFDQLLLTSPSSQPAATPYIQTIIPLTAFPEIHRQIFAQLSN